MSPAKRNPIKKVAAKRAAPAKKAVAATTAGAATAGATTGTAPPVVTTKAPADRLVDAVRTLAGGVEDLLRSHSDLHCCDGTSGGSSPSVPSTAGKTTGPIFSVSTATVCRKAACGKGEVDVGVPVATYPLPLAPTEAMHLVAGDLSGARYPVTQPASVPGGDDCARLSINPTLPRGTYVGHLKDQTGNLQRPFVIFLDGLP